jgi:hypothetical protein
VEQIVAKIKGKPMRSAEAALKLREILFDKNQDLQTI